MKYRQTAQSAALATVLVLASGLVMAHEGMHGPGSEYDADGSGALSLSEYTTYLKETKQDVSKAAARFAAIDANKDGEISSGEFMRGRANEAVK